MIGGSSLPPFRGGEADGGAALRSPDASLRIAGVVSAVLGVVLVWLVRGS